MLPANKNKRFIIHCLWVYADSVHTLIFQQFKVGPIYCVRSPGFNCQLIEPFKIHIDIVKEPSHQFFWKGGWCASTNVYNIYMPTSQHCFCIFTLVYQ